MRALDELEVRGALVESIRGGIPFLGICLGLQALFTSGEEAPEEEITFVYGQFGVCYVQQDEKGQTSAQPYEGWDQVQNIDAKAWMDPPAS